MIWAKVCGQVKVAGPVRSEAYRSLVGRDPANLSADEAFLLSFGGPTRTFGVALQRQVLSEKFFVN